MPTYTKEELVHIRAKNAEKLAKYDLQEQVEKITESEKVRVLNLRASGAQYTDIAKIMGFKGGEYVARKIAELAIIEYGEDPHFNTKYEQRLLINMRYDAMLMGIWPQVLQGNLPAISVALKIEADRRALNGLDVPPPTDKYDSGNVGEQEQRLAASIEIIKGAFNDPSVVESTGRILESLVSAPSGTRVPSE
jgi:hypothetical protein